MTETLSGSTENTSTQKPDRFYYNNLEELVKEWQEHGGESSLWDYLEVSETIFKRWWKRTKSGRFDT